MKRTLFLTILSCLLFVAPTVRAQEEKVFPGMRQNFEGGVSKCWDEDPWARGASSWYKPGQMSELWPHIARAEGRVHFAGDHTSTYNRWMQGALQSGNRAAREVNEAPWEGGTTWDTAFNVENS